MPKQHRPHPVLLVNPIVDAIWSAYGAPRWAVNNLLEVVAELRIKPDAATAKTPIGSSLQTFGDTK